jgi:hypothetical protein
MNAKQRSAKANLLDKFLVSYLLRFSEENELFIIEYEIVAATNNIIASKTEFVAKDFVDIANCLNQLVGKEHYDGAVWYDFTLRVGYFFSAFGYNSHWDSATGRFTFWKDRFRFWKWLARALTFSTLD